MRTHRIPLDDGPWLEENPPPPTEAPPPLSDEEQEALWWHWRQQLEDLTGIGGGLKGQNMTTQVEESPAARATHELLRQFAHLVTDDVYAAMKLALEMAYVRGEADGVQWARGVLRGEAAA